MKNVPLWVTKQTLFISATARKKRQHGGEPESDLVGGDSIKRGEPWEGKRECLWISGHRKGVLAWQTIHSSSLAVSQTPANMYGSSKEVGVFCCWSSYRMAKSLLRAVYCKLRCCWWMSRLPSIENLCCHDHGAACGDLCLVTWLQGLSAWACKPSPLGEWWTCYSYWLCYGLQVWLALKSLYFTCGYPSVWKNAGLNIASELWLCSLVPWLEILEMLHPHQNAEQLCLYAKSRVAIFDNVEVKVL